MSLWGIAYDSNAGVFINVHYCALVVNTALRKKQNPHTGTAAHSHGKKKYFLKAKIMITSEQGD